MKTYDRRGRCGNVGIRRFLPDFQARREGWKTRPWSFPGFPRRGISTATLPLRQLASWGETPVGDGEASLFGYEGEPRIFPQEVKS